MSEEQQLQQEIGQLQMLEQQLQNSLMQKQQLQMQLVEMNNALEELKKTKDDCFKIIGNIMVQTKNADVTKDLESKKEMVELHMKNLEKQEKGLKEKVDSIQATILEQVKKKEE